MFYGSYIFRSKLGNGLGNGFDHTREPRAIKTNVRKYLKFLEEKLLNLGTLPK